MNDDPEVQKLMFEKHKLRVGSAETWRQHIAASSHMFANDGIKALILLNGGAFIALPALKGFAQDSVVDSLLLTVIAFMSGLSFALLSQLCAYLSINAGAEAYRQDASAWEHALTPAKDDAHLEALQAGIDEANKLEKEATRKAATLDAVALSMAILSFVLFVIGGFSGISAFYPGWISLDMVPAITTSIQLKYVSVLGLCFDIAGAALIYVFGIVPKVTADGSDMVVVKTNPTNKRKAVTFARLSRFGIFLLCLGFLLQIAGTGVLTAK